MNVQQLHAGSFEAILAASDPIYVTNAEHSLACGGCKEAVSDTGESSAVRFFDSAKEFDSDGSRVFGPHEVEAVLVAMQDSGLDVEESSESTIRDYAARGWSVLLVRSSTPLSFDESFPLLTYRYSGTDVVVPMALSADNGGVEMQIVAVLVDKGRMEPLSSDGVQPELGQPLYRSEFTRQFYNARVRFAIQQAGGHAWVLEYANTLPVLAERFNESSLIWQRALDEETVDDDASVEDIFNRVTALGLTSPNFRSSSLFVTRWRTFVTPENMQDEEFGRSESDDTFEVTLGKGDFEAVSRMMIFGPLLVVGWAFRRQTVG
jgi:hypothetical protein